MEKGTAVIVKLTPDGAQRTFATPQEFFDWVKRESNAWGWLSPVRSSAPQVKPLIAAQLHTLANAITHMEGAQDDPAKFLRGAETGAAVISEAILKRRLLLSESADGQLCTALQLTGKQIQAAYALAYCLRIPLSLPEDSRAAVEGMLHAALQEYGLSAGGVAEKAALEALSAEHRQVIETSKSTASDILNTARTELAAVLESEAARSQERSIAEKSRIGEYEIRVGEQNDEFAQLKAAFLDYMKLKAPVEYWKTNALWTRVTAIAFGIVSLAWGGLIGWYVLTYAKEILSPKSQVVQAAKAAADNATAPIVTAQPVPLWEIGMFLLLVTLAIWLLRVLVRITLSNLHQSTDALSRATMTEAYLALIKEGSALPEKDRILVLTTLFRPIATGLIKDDAMPPSVVELLSRAIGGGKS